MGAVNASRGNRGMLGIRDVDKHLLGSPYLVGSGDSNIRLLYVDVFSHFGRLIGGTMKTLCLASVLILLAVTAHAGSVTLAWDASPSTGVTGYRLHYGTQSGVYTATLDAGNVTTATISGLADDTTYYIAATAYNPGYESNYSNEVSYRNSTVPTWTKPEPPGWLRRVNQSSWWRR